MRSVAREGEGMEKQRGGGVQRRTKQFMGIYLAPQDAQVACSLFTK